MSGGNAPDSADSGFAIRPWRDDDTAEVDAAIVASRDHLRPFLAWADTPTLDEAARAAWFAEREAAGDRVYVARDGTGALVGTVGLHRRIGPGGLEIGYWTHVSHLRRGVATAMARAMVALAFADPETTHVEIHHDVANAPSGRVPARLGFRHVEDRAAPIAAPGETGTQRIWRLDRPKVDTFVH